MKITINSEYDRQVPKLSEQEYSSLKQDINEYGQLYPIIINQGGIVLDGHHRFRICQELGLEPQYKVMEFKDKEKERVFVIKSNLSGKGRHLNKFRRTELALKSKPDLREIARKNESLGGKKRGGKGKGKDKGGGNLIPLGRVDDEIARMANVSRDTVTKVEKIIESLEEDDLERLRAEEVSVNQAYNRILEHERLERIHEAIEPLRPQIEDVLRDWIKAGGEMYNRFSDLSSVSSVEKLSEQKNDLCNKFMDYGMKEYYVKIVSGVFERCMTNKQLDPKNEMSRVLESIQKMKRVVEERTEKIAL